jgi:hypothetical protein
VPSLADPRRRRLVVVAALALLAWVALLLRWGIDAGGVLDVDVVNFGLAASRFDILDRQPQPPGYVGYVLLLKLLHGIAAGIDPVDLAKWGARLCGALTVPAAWWACRELLAEEDAIGRPLAAAGLAALHPLLWYYGADGQAHAAEALATLLLFAASVRVRRRPSSGRLLLVVAAFGLAGSLRPTIPLLSSPLLVWLFWGRPARDWALAFVVGVAAVAAWAAPLVALSGGWDVYQRANRALIGDLFIANFSAFGSRAHPVLVAANATKTAWWGAIALIPILAWGGRRAAGGAWRAWLAVVAANLLFYALVYAAEAGYLAAVAGLSCVMPASWPARAGRLLRARIALVAVGGPLLLLVGPGTAPVPRHPDAALPTLAHAIEVQAGQEIYREAVCGAANGQRAVLVTDNPSNTHTRRIPLLCPGVVIALYVGAMPFDPARTIDAWMIFFADGIMAVPTGIPLEPGPPAHVQLPEPVDSVLVAPDAGRALVDTVLGARSCEPDVYVHPGSGLAIARLATRCLPSLRTPTHSIDLTAPPARVRFGGL